SNHPESAVRFVATANGYGHAWADVKLNSAENEVTLQLVRDHPIDGRILTTDGRPAVGVEVAVTRLYRQINVSDDDTNPGSKMASAEMIAKTASNHSGTYTLYPEWPGQGPTSKPVFTDNDGRFRLEGLGAGSKASLEASGGGIGAMRLGIHNIPAPTDAKNDGMIAVREGLGESEYFAKFTHIAVPGRTIRGVVTDKLTGRPIEGVQVWVESSWPSRQTPASTDRDGRYELTGVQKAKEYQINLDPKTSLNFNKTRTLLDPSGLDPIECNLSLEQGIQYRGHVTDSETGKAVKGVVVYNPLYLSEDALRLGEEYQRAPASSTKIMEDGCYVIPVLPGPGAIGVQVAGKGFLSATVDLDRAKEIVGQNGFEIGAKGEVQHIQISAGKNLGGTMNVARFQGIAILSPSERVLPVVVDFKLTRSHSRPGTILDDAAKPLAGSHAIVPIGLGVTGPSGTDAPLHSSEFLVDGLSPGNPRTLLFLHPERELGAKVVVTGDEMTPIKVQMTKTGAVKGRFVDKFGKPLSIVL
ncbi:MAG TPA: carboxypeptidase-like regulatory domain-containing protein, partial [Pirellula sp.]|nr:carboxypeptidase-like regulatory domain-containing protein [Pirellula sp.]